MWIILCFSTCAMLSPLRGAILQNTLYRIERQGVTVVDGHGNDGRSYGQSFSKDLLEKSWPFMTELARTGREELLEMWVDIADLYRIVFVDAATSQSSNLLFVSRDDRGVVVTMGLSIWMLSVWMLSVRMSLWMTLSPS